MRAAIIDTLHFAAKLSLRKIWNYARLRWSFCFSILYRKSRHAGMPASLSVEPTTACNLGCPECPGGLKRFTRPQGAMPIKEFRNIIDQLKGDLVYLMLYFQGEPLLHPGIFDMFNYARENRIYTASSTNGHQLNDENARKIVESGPDRLIISVDGSDQEVYEKYRRGGDLETVTAGVKNVMKWKKELKSSTPFVIIQFLVFNHNEHQIPEMKELVKGLGADKLEIKTAQVYGFENDGALIPENPDYSRYSRGEEGLWKIKKPMRNHCFRMWSGAVITWDGRVVPCCFDKDAEHQLGLLADHSFKEIWRSKAYNEFRMKILKDRKRIDICRNCTE